MHPPYVAGQVAAMPAAVRALFDHDIGHRRARYMAECEIHKHRFVVPIDKHHIWPLSMGGPDEPGNIIRVCPNGHRRIHDYLRLLIRHKGTVPWLTRRLFGHRVRQIALRGWLDIDAHEVNK